MSRHFGTPYHPENYYMRGPGPACAQNARNILKTNARPASPVQTPARDAGPPFPSSPVPVSCSLNSGESEPSVRLAYGAGETRFVLDEAAFMAAIEPPSQALQNFAASAFSYFVLAVPFTLVFAGVSIWALFFAPSLID